MPNAVMPSSLRILRNPGPSPRSSRLAAAQPSPSSRATSSPPGRLELAVAVGAIPGLLRVRPAGDAAAGRILLLAVGPGAVGPAELVGAAGGDRGGPAARRLGVLRTAPGGEEG